LNSQKKKLVCKKKNLPAKQKWTIQEKNSLWPRNCGKSIPCHDAIHDCCDDCRYEQSIE
jgi:hypothetical protein